MSHVVPKISSKAKRRLSISTLQRHVDKSHKSLSHSSEFDVYVKEIKHPEISRAETRLEASIPSSRGEYSGKLSKGAARVISETCMSYDKNDFDSYVTSILKGSNISRSPESVRFDTPARIEEISITSEASAARRDGDATTKITTLRPPPMEILTMMMKRRRPPRMIEL